MLNFRRMREEDLQKVLDWRVKPEVAQFMLTEVAYDMAQQRLHKVHGKVLANNTGVLKMHKICGYRQVGLLKDHVLRNGRFMDVHVVELFRDGWQDKGKRFSKFVAEFETSAGS